MEITIINPKDTITASWLAARICYEQKPEKLFENKINIESKVKLLKTLWDKGHHSIFEHASYQFYIKGVSRSAIMQWTRHRIGWSFAIKSQHYQNHEEFKYKELEWPNISQNLKREYFNLMVQTRQLYKRMVMDKVPIYIAREVLPNACLVDLIVTTNIRALGHFYKLRIGPENTPEIRKIAEQLYKCLFNIEPKWKDILSNDKQD